MRPLITLIVLAGLGTGGWFGYQRWFNQAESIAFRTAEVQRGEVIASITATGTVEPLLKVLVGSQVSGTIEQWFADFNQSVSKDFVLAKLDQERFQADVDQRRAAVAVTRARVEQARARLAIATLERERIERAFGRDVASDFELDSRKAEELAATAALHAAEAQLQSAAADERQALIELDKTIIRSPIDGVVISRDVDAGQTVAASLSAPTLFTIANDLTKMRVNAAVTENDIGQIHEGMEATFRVDAYPDERFRGTISQVRYAETVVDNVVTYTTLIDVDNPELLLRPGMTATIQFDVAREEDALLVPNAALRYDPLAAAAPRGSAGAGGNGLPTATQPRVFRLEGEVLVEVPVALGLTDGRVTSVRAEGLTPGQLVVTGQDATAGRAGAPTVRRMMSR